MQVSEGPRIVRLGTADVVFPSAELQQIEDSAPLLGAGDGGAQLLSLIHISEPTRPY